MKNISKNQIEKRVLEIAKKFKPKSQYPMDKNNKICFDETKTRYLMVMVGVFESNRMKIFNANSYVSLTAAKSDVSGWLNSVILGRAVSVKFHRATPYKTVSAYIVDIKDYKIAFSKSLNYNTQTVEFFKNRNRNRIK